MRFKLQLLQDFSYLCKDETSLAAIVDCIGKAVTTANTLLKREGGLVLQPTPEKRRKVNVDTSKLRPLPSHKRKKKLSLFDRYKNRVGKFADVVKASSHIYIVPEAKGRHLQLAKTRKSILEKYQKIEKEKCKRKEGDQKCKEKSSKQETIQKNT